MRIRARSGIASGFRDYPRMPRRFPANRAEYRNRSLAARRVVRLVREMGGEAMTDRTFFVRVNLDDMATDLIGLDSTDERGLWLEGFVVGSRGKDSRVEWPKAKIEGYSFGLKCFNEAEEFRGKQSAKGQASADARRNRKVTAVQPDINSGSTAVQPDINPTNNQQPTTNNEKPNRERQAAFTPPSEQEWVEYCTRTWSDWHPVCAGESWAYYQGVGWIVGRKVCKDWKATARTAHGNARQWGKLQPQRQAWAPPAPAPITCNPGDLDGISMEAINRL